MRLASMLRVEREVAKDAVLEMFKEAGVAIVSIDIVVAESAVAAFSLRPGARRKGANQFWRLLQTS